MEKLRCGRSQCQNTAIKFCLNCNTLLCKYHRVEDMKTQQLTNSAEHYYVDTSQYSRNTDEFTRFYCKQHPLEILNYRCINCFQFTCNSCLPEWCSKAAGRYHDNDMIADLVSGYKEKIVEFQQKLQQKHEIFLKQFKDVCRTFDKTKADLEEILNGLDIIVEYQIATVISEGEKLKEHIKQEMAHITSEIAEKLKSIEEKEAMSRQLLHSIHETLRTADGVMVVRNYCEIEEAVTDILKWRTDNSLSVTFELIQSMGCKALDITLTKAYSSPLHVAAKTLPEVENSTQIRQIKQYASDGQRFVGINFLSSDKLLVCGYDRLSGKWFTETAEDGKSVSRELHNHDVSQLLVYGHQILVLIREWGTDSYRICMLETETTLYEFREDLSYFHTKLMAVTSDHLLMVLRKESQTLQIIAMDTRVEKEISLSVGMTVYGLIGSSDGKLVLSCHKDGIHSIVKYDTQLQEVIWVSDSLLADSVLERLPDWLADKLHVAGYKDDLYVLSRIKPSKIWRLSLSDGQLTHQIPCDGLPVEVLDISLRGNTLAVASPVDGIIYFRLSDILTIV